MCIFERVKDFCNKARRSLSKDMTTVVRSCLSVISKTNKSWWEPLAFGTGMRSRPRTQVVRRNRNYGLKPRRRSRYRTLRDIDAWLKSFDDEVILALYNIWHKLLHDAFIPRLREELGIVLESDEDEGEKAESVVNYRSDEEIKQDVDWEPWGDHDGPPLDCQGVHTQLESRNGTDNKLTTG